MKKLGLFAACLLPLAALAHTASVSFSEFEVHGDSLDAMFHFSAIDLSTVIQLDTQSQPALDALAPALARLLLEPVVITSAGKPCAMTPGRTAPDGPDGASIRAVFRCPAPIEQLSVRPGFIDIFPQGHTHLVKIVFGPSEVFQRVAQAEEPQFEVERAQRPLARLNHFLWLGLRRIALGPEQIAFLLALLLLGGALPELVKIVASLAIAQSIGLALATLAGLAPSTWMALPLAALGIWCVAFENLWALQRPGRIATALAHRWVLAFLFGLLHGLVFSSALAGLSRRGLALSLLGFNLGLLLGLALIASALLVALWLVRKRLAFSPLAARLTSGALAGAGAILLLARFLRR